MSPDLPPDPTINDWPLPYEQRLEARPLDTVDLVVIHCTELPDLALAREYGQRELYDSGTGNSGHYYIDRDGSIHVFVKPERVAHHTKGYNERSVGIELVNAGRYPDWLDSRRQTMDEPYTDAQVDALLALLQRLRREIPTLEFIAGHEDLDQARVPSSDNLHQLVFRKRDPGPRFPWSRVLDTVPLDRIRP
ncbi:N-acetylmuramoyl-L-alanine amidase [Arenimonas daejeonensis]|uniref:N-acetylmuramoyl-L-alanine amidase n=1 Tax=Arenimonas daejeonensis TaxID=370777 RepID=UPI0011BDE244|nr:N-acetylmuramoyl-L-alanine amidase [Arenimonas daejeonensis]